METTQTLLDSLVVWSERLVPDPVRAAELVTNLRTDDGPWGDPAQPVTSAVLRAVEEVCHRTARHLTLELHADPAAPDGSPPGWPAVPAEVVRGRAGFVRRVRRDEGIGVLQLDGFDGIRHGGPYLQAAFALLDGVSGLVLDLRRNGGGEISTLALVAEYVLGTGVEQLSTVHYREGRQHQWWTSGVLGERHLAPATPVAVLVGPATYSSGEGLAYHLHTRGRVRIFGQQTPGAADHVTPVRVTPSVTAVMPEGTPIDTVSEANWEGTGVRPDVVCSVEESESAAGEWLVHERD